MKNKIDLTENELKKIFDLTIENRQLAENSAFYLVAKNNIFGIALNILGPRKFENLINNILDLTE